MKYYIYKIINNNTKEFYIGKRKCKCEIKDDAYMGSGVRIKASVAKQGESTFTKKILAVCNNDEELAMVEGAYINYNIVSNFCLNIAKGDMQSRNYFRKQYWKMNNELERQKNMYDMLKQKHEILLRIYYNTDKFKEI